MTIVFLDFYNEVAEQAWSMYDADTSSKDEFESALKSSIQKALSELWCSYNFPWRLKTQKIKTKVLKNVYELPPGKIFIKTINGKEVYSIKCNKKYLKYLSNYEELIDYEETTGEPTGFYVKGDKLYLFNIPDDVYTIEIEYYTLVIGYNKEEEDIYTLEEEDDIIEIPEKYEVLFKNALKTLSLAYSIADTTDENYEQYMIQYNRAYKLLIDYCSGIELNKRITW